MVTVITVKVMTTIIVAIGGIDGSCDNDGVSNGCSNDNSRDSNDNYVNRHDGHDETVTTIVGN